MQVIDYFKKELTKSQNFDFEKLALQIFEFQAQKNEVYKQYIQFLGINQRKIQKTSQIPFLPIEFFKNQNVRTIKNPNFHVFESSGTTGQQTSRHNVSDLDFYAQISVQIFEKYYGQITDYHILALLPSYLERQNSSLVYMVQTFMKKSDPDSGFFLNNLEELREKIKKLAKSPKKILLIGVTFALLELAKTELPELKNAIVMETGGMKGRGKELLREELHQILKNAFHCKQIHSEYGMTELLSQAYAKENAFFEIPKSMKVFIREMDDPFAINQSKTGGLNIIDLANLESCCFLETKDIARINAEGTHFQIMGRYDASDIRGCNLLVL
ncbi:MAG: acyl transferase [Bacteroidetes bacterium]|nr:MAG: acyl transferase [Bacteroidota bacterium]